MIRSDVRNGPPSSNMAEKENTNMEVDGEKKKTINYKAGSLGDKLPAGTRKKNNMGDKRNAKKNLTTTEYCEKLQVWMWQYYAGYVNWQSWLAAAALPYPHTLQSMGGTSTTPLDINSQTWYNGHYGLSFPPQPSTVSPQSSQPNGTAGGAAVSAQPQQLPQENGNAQRPGEFYFLNLLFITSL